MDPAPHTLRWHNRALREAVRLVTQGLQGGGLGRTGSIQNKLISFEPHFIAAMTSKQKNLKQLGQDIEPATFGLGRRGGGVG